MIQSMSEDEFNHVMAQCKIINDNPSTQCRGFIAHAVIDKNPDYFENNFNIVFEKGCDDLDEYEWSALWLEEETEATIKPFVNSKYVLKHPFALQRYAGIIDPAINIMIPDDFYSIEVKHKIVTKILKEFKLDETNLVWIEGK